MNLVFGSTIYWSTIVVVVQDSVSLQHMLKFQVKMGNTTLVVLHKLLLSMLPEAFTSHAF